MRPEAMSALLMQQVMAAAHTAASEEAAGDQSWVSFPIPFREGDAFGLVFHVCGTSIDYESQTLSAFPPSATVHVELPNLECKVDPAPEASNPLVGAVWTKAANEAGPAMRESLMLEAFECAVALAPVMGEDPSDETRAQLERFDLLYRYLVGPELRPHSVRLGPDFFNWRNTHLSADLESEPATAPIPAHPPTSSAIPDPVAASEYRKAEGLPQQLEVSTAALMEAVRELGLAISEHSPLVGVDASGEIGAYRLQDLLPGWPTPGAKAALGVLCSPELRIEVACGTRDVSIFACVCAGVVDDVPTWVRYEEEDGTSSLVFPDASPWIKELIQETLASPPLRKADPTVNQLSTAEFAAVLAITDHVLGSGNYEAAIDVADLVAQSGGLGWSAVESMARAEGEASPVAQGVDELRLRGLLDGESSAFAMTSALRGFVQGLGPVEAFAAIQTVETTGDDVPLVSGLSLVRTPEELWAWEPDESGTLNFWRVTGPQLSDIIDDLIGTGEGEGEA